MDEFEKWLEKQLAIYGASDEDYTGGKCDAYENALEQYLAFKAKADGGLGTRTFLALKELYAIVKGECPSLIDEDSGGDARIEMEIKEILRAHEGGRP